MVAQDGFASGCSRLARQEEVEESESRNRRASGVSHQIQEGFVGFLMFAEISAGVLVAMIQLT